MCIYIHVYIHIYINIYIYIYRQREREILYIYIYTLYSPQLSSPSLFPLQGPQVITYVYELVDGEVKVKKIEHTKGVSSTVAAPPAPVPTPAPVPYI